MSSMSTNSLTVVIVEKTAVLRSLTIKNYCHAELYKKCGYKQENGFAVRATWPTMLDGNKTLVHLYGKADGRAGNENKCDFPPPADTLLLFGTCLLLASTQNSDGEYAVANLSIENWTKINETLFGGFESVSSNGDDAEPDELDDIDASKKTKTTGYLKDGFVVDSDSETNDVVAKNDDDVSTNGPDIADDNSYDSELSLEEYV